MCKHLLLKQQASVLVQDLSNTTCRDNPSLVDMSNYKAGEYQNYAQLNLCKEFHMLALQTIAAGLSLIESGDYGRVWHGQQRFEGCAEFSCLNPMEVLLPLKHRVSVVLLEAGVQTQNQKRLVVVVAAVLTGSIL